MGQRNRAAYGFYRMETGSMRPTLCKGDFILVERVLDSSFRLGDILLFPPTKRYSLTYSHRLVKMIRRREGIDLLAKGDANCFLDPPIPVENVLGRASMIFREGKGCIVLDCRLIRILGWCAAYLYRFFLIFRLQWLDQRLHFWFVRLSRRRLFIWRWMRCLLICFSLRMESVRKILVKFTKWGNRLCSDGLGLWKWYDSRGEVLYGWK